LTYAECNRRASSSQQQRFNPTHEPVVGSVLKKDMDEELINVDHDKQGRQDYAYAPEFTLETSQEKEYYSSDTTSSTKQLL
jgi:hypothetical protein